MTEINFWWRFFFVKPIIPVLFILLYWDLTADIFQGFVQIFKDTQIKPFQIPRKCGGQIGKKGRGQKYRAQKYT